jgi:hypothetical protein
VATWGRGGVGLKALFPGQTGPVAATWFTGKLKVPQGKIPNPAVSLILFMENTS